MQNLLSIPRIFIFLNLKDYVPGGMQRMYIATYHSLVEMNSEMLTTVSKWS